MALKQLGKYEILDLVGSGATADVYRALDKVLDREVALKVLKPSLVYDNAAFARFLKEARSAANLFHPNIATILDTAEVNGRYFIAMRYIEGKSLDRILKDEGPLSYAETLRMADQVGSALHYAHQRGFLHQDIKPSNIIRSTQDEYFLTDFGLVRAIMHTGFSSLTGSILGTPTYIPPEIWLNHSHSAAVDQYALACVLYEVITGKVLFDGDTPPAIMTAHVLKGCGSLDDLPEHMRVPMQRALKQTAEERYPDVQSFIEALHQSQITTQAKPHTPPAESLTKEKQLEKNKQIDTLKLAEEKIDANQIYITTPTAITGQEPPTKQSTVFTSQPPKKTAEPLIANASSVTAAAGEQEHAARKLNIFQRFTHWLNQSKPQESKSQDHFTRDKCVLYWQVLIVITLGAWLITGLMFQNYGDFDLYIVVNLWTQVMLGLGFGLMMAFILDRIFRLSKKEKTRIVLGWLIVWMLIFMNMFISENYFVSKYWFFLNGFLFFAGALVMVLSIRKSFALELWEILLIPLAWAIVPFVPFVLRSFWKIPDYNVTRYMIIGTPQGIISGAVTLAILYKAQKRKQGNNPSYTSLTGKSSTKANVASLFIKLVHLPSIVLISIIAWLVVAIFNVTYPLGAEFVWYLLHFLAQLTLGPSFGLLIAFILHQAFGFSKKEKLYTIFGWTFAYISILMCVWLTDLQGGWPGETYVLNAISILIGAVVMVLAIRKSFALRWWEIVLIPLAWAIGPFIGWLFFDTFDYEYIFLYFIISGALQGILGGITTLVILQVAKLRKEKHTAAATP